MRVRQYRPVFVKSVPAVLAEGVLYVSVEYRTAIHLCACGCRSEVVTPLRPDKWAITYDGSSVSMRPSLGNWSFPCRSHYWIVRDGMVSWDRTWSDEEVRLMRQGYSPAGPIGAIGTKTFRTRVTDRIQRLFRP
ncbi:MAG: hypothetical protein QOE42_430 [Chloroflexota bacterium]|jgi:hypothetical protein|nr:hypothetical protein [Chloroflexota bacterium]